MYAVIQLLVKTPVSPLNSIGSGRLGRVGGLGALGLPFACFGFGFGALPLPLPCFMIGGMWPEQLLETENWGQEACTLLEPEIATGET